MVFSTPSFMSLGMKGEVGPWPGLFFFSRPSTELLVSTMAGNVISTVLAVYAFDEPLDWQECATVWAYDLVALLAVDLAKMAPRA